METSEDHLLLLLKKMQELEAEHANLQHEFSSLILNDDVSSRPKIQWVNLFIYLIPVGCSFTDIEMYRNRSAEKLYGYSASEALGQSILDLLTDAKEAREDAIDIMQCNAAGETWTGNFPVKNKQGKRFMVFVTNTLCMMIIVVLLSFLQLPLPYLEAYSSFSPPTSGPTSKPGYDSQQPMEVVVTASGACTLRGEAPPSPFDLSYTAIHMDNYPGFFPEDSSGESKIQIHNIITSNVEAWNIQKQISRKCKGSEHDGLVARNAHGIFPWMKNEQEDDFDQKKSPDSYEKPEMQLLGRNRFGNEASASWSSSNATNKSSVNNRINTGSSPLCKFDRETDSLHYDILWEDLMIYEQIGRGSCGTVYRGVWCGLEVALKVFSKFEYSDDLLHSFRQEVLLMKALRHPNVLLFMGAVTLSEHLCIVTEFLTRGSLFQLLQRSTCKLDRRRRVLMALDIARGMNYLHNCDPPVVHRDLKSSNLLVDKNWTMKVGDFGLSRIKHATYLTTKTGNGTPQWMAPEVIRNDPSDERSDVYSFGVILWELATRKIPWDTLNSMQVIGAVGFMDQRIEIPKDTDPHWASLIESCWHSEPKCRPSFQDLLKKLKDMQKRYSIETQATQLEPRGSITTVAT
ncbi:hypothetical protein C5167_015055 [Papaver somniferum]|uniref:non-specific serine/threonine protein kinase n=1 Tax=Papaver somniferum TaxID=3469 RepID=A0A4Y7J817_PAPSO|nr:hypothetical protein C5167_015055 [Papaver somniferum]